MKDVVSIVGEHRVLDPAGPQSAQIQWMWNFALGLCSLVLAAVLAGLLVALWRASRGTAPVDRRAAAQADRRARRWMIGATSLTVALLIALFVADALTHRAISRLPVAAALRIDLVSYQWWWQVRYGDESGGADEGGDGPGFVTANELVIPTGRPVVIALRSADVIHSFWAPNLHGKRDLLPGRTSTIALRADREGRFLAQCAEFCGTDHASMAMNVVAVSPDAFADWSASRRRPASDPEHADGGEARASAAARAGKAVFVASGCGQCHTVRGTAAGGQTGPDLTHVGARETLAAGMLANTPANLSAWLENPASFKRGTSMPPAALDKPRLDQLVAYLSQLR